MSIENFRAKLKDYLRGGGYSQKQLAYELAMPPALLSNKFNGHNYANLTYAEVKQIVKILVSWSAISTRQEALELLTEMGLGFSSFKPEEWSSPPLNSLLENSPTPYSKNGLPPKPSLKTLEVTLDIPPSQLQQQEASIPAKHNATISKNGLREEWQGTPVYVKELYGREAELRWLEEQVCQRNARLVGLMGIGGVGKTALAVEFSQMVKTRFEYVIWYSLHNAPPLETMLAYFLNILLEPKPLKKPVAAEPQQQLIRLLECLQQARCLLILDNFETLLADGKQSGTYLSGYEGYGQLLELIGEQNHQSTMLVTSRDKPKELGVMENRYPQTVSSLVVGGLNAQAGRQLLAEVGTTPISGTTQEWQQLIDYYFGNPLALKLLAEPLQLLFGGKIRVFLQEGWGVFADIEELLKQQFDRLSKLEREILYWLAVERQVLSLEELKADFRGAISSKELVEALISLKRRSLLEGSEKAGYFSLQPVILEYLTQRLIEQVVEEINQGSVGAFLDNYALLKAETKDYIRESQRNLIIFPVLNRLKLELNGREPLIQRLWQLVAQLKTRSLAEQGYAAGNLINLLVELKVALSKADFSKMRIWQAYLQGIGLEEVNFARSDLRGSLFTNAFSAVEAVAFSPQGQLLASAGLDGTIRLWEVSTGQCLAVFEGHDSRVWSVAFSPNGKLLASGSADYTVRLWKVDGEQHHATYQGHTGEVYSVAFSPDGKLIASGSVDQTVRLWDSATGQCLKVLAGHRNEVNSVAFSPDGKLIASGCADQTIRLWDSATGQCLKILSGDLNWVWSVAFSPDGQLLASGSSDSTVRLWEVTSGVCRCTFQGHTNRVYSVAFSPDGKLVASGSSDQTVRLWDIARRECRSIFQGHLNLIKSITFSPDGQLLASGSPDQSIRLWEIESGQCLRVYEGYSTRINAAAYTPDGQYLANGSDDNTIRLWKVATASLYQTFQSQSFVKSIAFSPNGKLLASGGADNLIRIWDIESGACLKILQGYPSWVWSVAFSPDGQTLANGGNDRNIYLWEVASGQRLKILEGHTNHIRKVVFSPDGKLLASGSNDQAIRLWDVTSGQCLNTFEGHSNHILSVAFSPDGQVLASCSADQTIRLWEVASGQCLKILEGHSNWVWVVGFTPDGQYLVSSGYDHKVKVWSAKNWQYLFDLPGHKDIIRTLAFDPTTPKVAGGDENCLRLWDLQTKELVQVLKNAGLYEKLNIYGVTGLSAVQEANLIALGAIRNSN